MFVSVIDRVSRKVREARHLRQCEALLNTPPIIPRNDGLILFSMIGTAVVLPYLLAIKSLHFQLKRGRIVLVDDGTLTAADKAVLADQLGNPPIIPIASVETAPCPRGGTWERLLTILELRANDYVIQLDSDTVTLGPVPEVIEAIEANRSFSIAGGPRDAEVGFVPLDEFTRAFYAEGPADGHIQAVLESQIMKLKDAGSLRYGRACSGFAGFAKGGGGLERARDFSVQAEALTGQRWSEWGTEQITSNFVIANEAGSSMLPYGRYFNYWNEPWGADMRFIHFVGTFRHVGNSYRRATAEAIALLRA